MLYPLSALGVKSVVVYYEHHVNWASPGSQAIFGDLNTFLISPTSFLLILYPYSPVSTRRWDDGVGLEAHDTPLSRPSERDDLPSETKRSLSFPEMRGKIRDRNN